MGTGYVFSPLHQPSSPVEQKVTVQEITSSAEDSSEDHTPITSESEQGGGDTFQGVDLDRLFDRRHSPGSRKRKIRQEALVPSHGLLPTPAIVATGIAAPLLQ